MIIKFVMRLVWVLGCQATLELFDPMAASPVSLITLRSVMHSLFAIVILRRMCWKCMSYVSVNQLLDFVPTFHCLHVCAIYADCDPQQKQAMQRLFCQTLTGAFGCLTGFVHAFMFSVIHCSWKLVAPALYAWQFKFGLIMIGNNALHMHCWATDALMYCQYECQGRALLVLSCWCLMLTFIAACRCKHRR